MEQRFFILNGMDSENINIPVTCGIKIDETRENAEVCVQYCGTKGTSDVIDESPFLYTALYNLEVGEILTGEERSVSGIVLQFILCSLLGDSLHYKWSSVVRVR